MAGEDGDSRDEQSAQGSRKVERITSVDAPAIYANNVSLRTNLWDIRMEFGEVVEASEERLLIRDTVTVLMSPQHARIFAELLARHIRDYEAKFGPIPRPPDEASENEDGATEPTH